MRSQRVLALTLWLCALVGLAFLWFAVLRQDGAPAEGPAALASGGRPGAVEKTPDPPDPGPPAGGGGVETLTPPDPTDHGRSPPERPGQPAEGGARAVQLHGRIVTKRGRPVSGAMVLVAPHDDAHPWPLDALPRRLGNAPPTTDVTDRAGRFELSGLEPGYHRIAVRAARHAHLDLEGLWLPQDRVDLGELRLQPGHALEGRVVDPSGRVVKGAEVVLLDPVLRRDALDSNAACGAPLARTTGLGRFATDSIHPGPYTLLVSHPEHPERVVTGWAHEGTNKLTVALESGHELSGALRGAPAGAAFVVHAFPLRQLLRAGARAHGTDFEHTLGYRRAEVQTRGRFALTGLPLGSRTYLELRPASRPIDAPEGFVTWAIAEPGESVRLDLLRGMTLTCEVEGASGRPLEDFDLSWRGAFATRPLEPARGHVFWEGIRPLAAEQRRGKRWVAHPAGLTLAAPGYEPLELGEYSFSAGEVLDLGLLRPTALVPLEVRVVDARTGRAVSGAEVSAGGATHRTGGGGRASVRTRVNDVAVRVRHPRYATRVESLGLLVSDRVAVSLEPHAACEVTVEDRSGRPVPQAEVLLTRWLANPWTEDVGGVPVIERAFPDAEGRVRFADVELGRSFLAARLMPRLGSVETAALHWTAVDALPGGLVAVSLPVQRLETLRGQVRLGREPLAGAELQLERGADGFADLAPTPRRATPREAPARTRADERGHFVFPHLTEGEYSLTIRHAPSALRTRRTVRVGKGTARIDVGDTRVRGHVLDASGAALPEVAVRVRAHPHTVAELGERTHPLRPELPLLAETETNASGWFQLDTFPPGVACDLVFETPGFSATVADLTVAAGRTEQLLVALEEHGELVVETRGLPRTAGLEPFLCASSAARPRPSGLLLEPLARRGPHELPPGIWNVRLALVQEGEVVTRFGPWEQVEIEAGAYTEVTLSLADRGRR